MCITRVFVSVFGPSSYVEDGGGVLDSKMKAFFFSTFTFPLADMRSIFFFYLSITQPFLLVFGSVFAFVGFLSLGQW